VYSDHCLNPPVPRVPLLSGTRIVVASAPDDACVLRPPAPGRATDPMCVVRGLHVIRRKERLAVLLSADRYLHHMARNIVGSAVAVGRGARDADWLGAVRASRDRTRAGQTAPAQGLALVRVLYPG